MTKEELIITPLEQEIAKILIITSDKQRLIEMLIDLLRTKEEIISNLENHNETLKSCLRTRNNQLSKLTN